MSLYNFDTHQQFVTIDNVPDPRTDAEKLNSMLSVYNHDNNDIALMERQVEELINISGAFVTIFKRNRNQANRDEIFDEDADPTYTRGVKLKGMFIPQPAEAQLTRWGVDIQNQTTIHFSRANVFKTFGKFMITEGDIAIIPHNTLTVAQVTDLREGIGNRLDRYRVIKSSDTVNFKYRWMYWSCILENLTGDTSIDVDFSKEYA
jgi:hypothetical protein